jgi:methylenetetrahydrofolate reductase (NADPH)
MSKLQESLRKGAFTITGEVGPPKGVDLVHLWKEEVDYIQDRVVAINVTDNQSAVMRVCSMGICTLLAKKGLEPILQITTRDRNRLAIQADVLGAYVNGIRNILSITGDHNTAGDHPGSIPVYDLDSVSLLYAMNGLKDGKDLAGMELEGIPSDLFIGGVVTPGADPIEMQLIKMERKIEAGAQFFQTQAIYDPKVFENFMKQAEKFEIPVLCGIVIIKSAGMAKYMNNFVPGVFVPDEMIKKLSEAPKEERAMQSVEMMAEFIREIKPMCQGLHIMAMGWEKYVPALLDMCDM